MAAVHALPAQMLSGYSTRQSLNVMHPMSTSGPSGLLTPPVTTRKRKRAHQYTVSYSEVQEVDSDGRLREVIVIEDTPPPPPTISPSTTHNGAFSASYQPPVYSAPIRTRARAAAEAQGLSASSSSITAPALKKRKRDHNEEVRAPATKKPLVGSQHSQTAVAANSIDSRSGAATEDVGISILCFYCPHLVLFPQQNNVSCDDKEGHYIIVPDDMIHSRCMTRYTSNTPL